MLPPAVPRQQFILGQQQRRQNPYLSVDEHAWFNHTFRRHFFCLGPRIANVNKEVCFEERSSQENLLLPRQFIPDGDIQLHTHTHTTQQNWQTARSGYIIPPLFRQFHFTPQPPFYGQLGAQKTNEPVRFFLGVTLAADHYMHTCMTRGESDFSPSRFSPVRSNTNKIIQNHL